VEECQGSMTDRGELKSLFSIWTISIHDKSEIGKIYSQKFIGGNILLEYRRLKRRRVKIVFYSSNNHVYNMSTLKFKKYRKNITT
jgi:hypothetical protein